MYWNLAKINKTNFYITEKAIWMVNHSTNDQSTKVFFLIIISKALMSTDVFKLHW